VNQKDLPRTKKYKIRPLSEIDINDFECTNKELTNFFKEDSFDNEAELVSKIYFLTAVEDKYPLVGFSISNAEIKAVNDINMVMPQSCLYKTFPAVRIGKFATNINHEAKGLGKLSLNLIKKWFVFNNKTGCRFIVVDARKEKGVPAFYKKCGFEMYPIQETNAGTYIMYCDLFYIKQIIENSN